MDLNSYHIKQASEQFSLCINIPLIKGVFFRKFIMAVVLNLIPCAKQSLHVCLSEMEVFKCLQKLEMDKD